MKIVFKTGYGQSEVFRKAIMILFDCDEEEKDWNVFSNLSCGDYVIIDDVEYYISHRTVDIGSYTITLDLE